MKVMHDRVAAIDVYKDMVKVAVRVPGERRGTRKTDVLEFRTFYGVLEEMGRELRRRGPATAELHQAAAGPGRRATVRYPAGSRPGSTGWSAGSAAPISRIVARA